MAFGKTLFGGSRFLFWALAVPLMSFMVVMLLLVERWTVKTFVVVLPLVLGAGLLLLALASPVRFRWAGRTLAAMVFLAYSAYAVEMWFFSSAPVRLFERRSEPSPVNSLLGLLIIGVPSFLYAAFGRFSLFPEQDESVPEPEEPSESPRV